MAIAGEAGARAKAAYGRVVRFVGADLDYWLLMGRGAVLLMLTLGIYRFWLATDMRRFLWSNTDIDGHTLEYSGTPIELLVGFLIALVVLLPVYIAFFIAALEVGLIGQFSGMLGVVGLGFLGQYALYRARRYQLTRTLYRGIRFQQMGSAWRYAASAVAWWAVIALTLGLAYPFAQASLERYKLRNTSYGDLEARFEGSGANLLRRGLLMWLLVMGPLLVGLVVLIAGVDREALVAAVSRGGSDEILRLERTDPNLSAALGIAVLAIGAGLAMALLLLPAFQSMLLRWWASGIRFGDVKVRSRLSTGRIYAAYFLFIAYCLGFAALLALFALIGSVVVSWLAELHTKSAEIAVTVLLVGGYVVAALGLSTIYQASVKLAFWRHLANSLELSASATLAYVHAVGKPSSPFGEGLADALHVGRI